LAEIPIIRKKRFMVMIYHCLVKIAYQSFQPIVDELHRRRRSLSL